MARPDGSYNGSSNWGSNWRSNWPPGFPPARVAASFAVLGAALGAMIDGGLAGVQAGLAAGLVLAFLPTIARRTAAALARPDGLPRFLGRQVATSVVAAAQRLLDRLQRWLGPPIAVIGLLLLPLRFVAEWLVGLAGAALARLGRLLATPLGMANLAGLAILAGDVAGVPVFSLAVPLGLLALVLTLLVSESERKADGAVVS